MIKKEFIEKLKSLNIEIKKVDPDSFFDINKYDKSGLYFVYGKSENDEILSNIVVVFKRFGLIYGLIGQLHTFEDGLAIQDLDDIVSQLDNMLIVKDKYDELIQKCSNLENENKKLNEQLESINKSKEFLVNELNKSKSNSISDKLFLKTILTLSNPDLVKEDVFNS